MRYVIDSGVGKTDEAAESNDSTGAADIPLDERILNHYEYDAFGNLLECEERVYNPFRYTGEQYDRTTQLYYLRARYYNPVIGRFMQQDTYLGDGLNLYAYVQNNPVRYVDPSGHCKQHCKDNGVDSSREVGGSNLKNILNVGAGDNLIPCATNIDINPSTEEVIFGDVNDLSQFASGQFDHVIALNPYGYKLLDSDVPRVLKEGGIMTVTGNYSNPYFKSVYKASPEVLSQAGFEVVSKGEADSIFLKYGGKVTGGARQTRGIPLQIVLKKVGAQ